MGTISRFIRPLLSGDQREKEDRRLLLRLAKRLGFDLISPHFVWREQPYFRQAAEFGETIPGIPAHRCFLLQSALRGLSRIDGDVAECGVRAGKSAYFIMTADERDRHFHLFDSFEGLSEPTAEDVPQMAGMRVAEKGVLSASEQAVARNLASFSKWTAYRGWIPSRFPEVAGRKFALVHIDVDLYEPTRDSLEFFLPRLAPGGLIICDDYGSGGYPGARRACDEIVKREGLLLIEIPTGQAIISRPAG